MTRALQIIVAVTVITLFVLGVRSVFHHLCGPQNPHPWSECAP